MTPLNFTRTNWKNRDKTTPLSAENMNKIEDAIVDLIKGVNSSKITEENLADQLNFHITDLLISLNQKVDKIEGKQLSTEDFTTEFKTQLEELHERVKHVYVGNQAPIDIKFDTWLDTTDQETQQEEPIATFNLRRPTDTLEFNNTEEELTFNTEEHLDASFNKDTEEILTFTNDEEILTFNTDSSEVVFNKDTEEELTFNTEETLTFNKE